MLSRPARSPGHARLRLGGDARVAQRVTVVLPDGRPLDVYNTHLADGDEAVRTAQARRLLAWMDERPDSAPGAGRRPELPPRLGPVAGC